MKHMHLTFDNAARATLDGKSSNITLIDAMGGKLGTVKRITIDLEIEAVSKPVVPLIKSAAPAPVAKVSAAKAAEAVVKQIKKGTKVEKLFKALMQPNGVTMEKLAKALGMTESGAGSYLYYYPKQNGCEVSKVSHEGKATTYHLVKPDNVELTFA